MSNPPPTFRGTITAGIQDISALLPLLGTDQCEKHIGSTLDGGFLYSAATPLSLFGSLGIVRASVSILVASLNIPHYQFIGAKLLYHSGFSLSGTVAPMIALDPKHPDRFLAETKLEEMLAEQYIINVPGLTVSWPEGAMRWNLMFVASTLLISSAGLLPYMSLILGSGDASSKLLFPLGFGFPILRVFGSAICVIAAQFLIQLRIIILMKTRLLFISIDRLAKLDKIDVGLNWANADNVWTSEVAAERNIWALRKLWFSTPSIMANVEKGSSYQQIKALYTSEYARHFGAINSLLHSWIPVFLCSGLAIGCISTVVGYIGCFFLVQHSTSSKGPLLWLALEAVLSVLRIFVWALNPLWDDPNGIKFELQLFTSPSLLTCDGTLEAMRAYNFQGCLAEGDANLEDIVAYAGLRPTFCVQGVEIFYVVAINSRNIPSKRLLIVISTERQSGQRSRLVFKEDANGPFIIHRCNLKAFTDSAFMGLHVGGQTRYDSHILTSNSGFMAELEAHYDKINFLLQNRDTTKERRAIFKNTWAMQQPPVATTNNYRPPTEADIEPPVLAGGEKARFDCYATESDTLLLYRELDEWITNQIAVYNQSIHHVPGSIAFIDEPGISNEVVSFLERHEDIEKMHLLVECWRHLEQFLICVHVKWVKDIYSIHADAVEANLEPFHSGPDKFLPGVTRINERQRNSIYGHRLKTKLVAERDLHFNGDYDRRWKVVTDRFNAIAKQIPNHIKSVQMPQRVATSRGDIGRHYSKSVSISNPTHNLADIFRLPSDLATDFSETVSVLEQYHILLQLQKSTFFEEMERRFTGYPLSLDNEAKVVIDKAKERCRTRANQLFEMLRLSNRVDLKDIIDSPGLPSPSKLRVVLINVNREWSEKVQRVAEGVTRMGAESERERVAQNVQQGAEGADSESEGMRVDWESEGLARMGADSESEGMGTDLESKGMGVESEYEGVGAELESKGERVAQNIQQGAEEFTRIDAESEGKHVGQTKITQYFAKQSAR